MTPTVKILIMLALLVVGAWVSGSGIQENETLTTVLGIAALIRGLAILTIHRRSTRSELRP